MTSPFPFLSNEAVFDPNLVSPCSEEILMHEVLDNNTNFLEIKYGVLFVIKMLAPLLNVDMPSLNNLLSPITFEERLREISQFYSNVNSPSGITISSLDAFNYLKIHALGGDMGDIKSWVTGLTKTGVFTSAGKCVIGMCKIRPIEAILNGGKKENGFWSRPWFMVALNKEFRNFRLEICRRNASWIDDTLHELAQEAALTEQLLKACLLHMSIVLKTEYCQVQNPLGPQVWICGIVSSCPFSDTEHVSNTEKQMKAIFMNQTLELCTNNWLQPVAVQSSRGLFKFFEKK